MTFSAWPDIHSSWYPVLQPVASDMQQLLDQLHARRSAGEPIEPAPDSVLRVFRMPLTEVKVLLVGQRSEERSCRERVWESAGEGGSKSGHSGRWIGMR